MKPLQLASLMKPLEELLPLRILYIDTQPDILSLRRKRAQTIILEEFRMKRAYLVLLLCLGSMLMPVLPAWAVTYAYIPSFANNRVVRVNTSAPANFATYTFNDPGLACSPYGAAVAPDGSFVIVTCAGVGQDSVAFLSNASFAQDPVAPVRALVGGEPRGVAIDPTKTFAYVSNYGSDSVTVITIADRSITATIPVGRGPLGIAAVLAPDENVIKVYVANHLDNSVTVITNNNPATRTISPVGIGPVGVTATPDGRHVFVASSGANQVSVIDTIDDALIGSVDVGHRSWGIAVGSQGQFAYVTNGDHATNSVTVIRTSDFRVVGRQPAGNRPHGIAAPVNGDFAYAINRGIGDSAAGTISEIDMAAGVPSVHNLTMPEPNPLQGAFALGTFIGGTPPNAPSRLSGTASRYDRIELTWNRNSTDESGFILERRKKGDAEFSELVQMAAGATSYTDGGVLSETTYEYRIRAFNEAAFSAYATSSEITTPEGKFHWCFIGTLVAEWFD